MDPDLRVRAKTLDAAVIGARVREARLRAGLTQGELAGEGASTAYVSRIEAGSRRPGLDLLVTLAERSGTSLESLLAPDDDAPEYLEQVAGVQLQLDHAELALQTGRLDQALSGSASVAGNATTTASLRRRGAVVHALATESGGDLDEAVAQLERLSADQSDGLLWIGVMIALARCYRTTGDLARAVDVGERAWSEVDRLGLAGTDEAVQLSLVVARSHHRGDLDHALRRCLQTLETADEMEAGAPAGACWNSSLAEAGRGNVVGAVALSQRALGLLGQREDARNLARLRTEIGLMQLELDPSDVRPAVANLDRARLELDRTGASPHDKARTLLGRAQAASLLREPDRAGALLVECLALAGDDAADLESSAHLLLARIAADAGHVEEEAAAMTRAEDAAARVGPGRGAAQLWYEIATVHEDRGDVARALAAFRRAGSSSGLTSTARRHADAEHR